LHLLLSWQLVLSGHGFLHVFKKLSNDMLVLLDFLFIFSLFLFKLLSKFIDFLFFLMKNLIFLLLTLSLTILFLHVLINFSDILLVLINSLLNFEDFLIHMLNLSIVLLDPVLESFSRFWKWQVHFISLQLKIFLLFGESCFLLFKVLSSLSQLVRSELTFRLSKSLAHLLQLRSCVRDLDVQHVVFLFQSFVLISLFWI